MILQKIVAIDPLTGALIPRKARITLGFELALLERHVERQPVEDRLAAMTLKQRVLECLPMGAEHALRTIEVRDMIPAAKTHDVTSHLSALAYQGLCQRVGQPGQYRYYRELSPPPLLRAERPVAPLGSRRMRDGGITVTGRLLAVMPRSEAAALTCGEIAALLPGAPGKTVSNVLIQMFMRRHCHRVGLRRSYRYYLDPR
jgi:hypothetical protein